MQYDLHQYKEEKPNRARRVCWFFFNCLVFPLLPNKWRHVSLRLFGAKVGILCRIYRSVRVYAPWNLTIGDRVCLGPGINLYNKAKITIGCNVVVSQGVFVCTASHDISSPVMALVTSPISIGDKCWVAANATILPGVTIGEGAVVGACAVVSKDIPSWAVAVGNPARVVKRRELK